MRDRWYRSLAVEVTILVMLGTSLVFAVVLSYSYDASRDIIRANAEQWARNLALSTAQRIDLRLRTAEAVTANMASFLQKSKIDALTLNALLRENVQENPQIFGSAVAFEPFTFRPDMRGYATYYYRGASGIEHTNLATDSYDYRMQDWYSVPKDLKRPVWSPPYFDEGGGNIIMTTYSVPFFEPEEGGGKENLFGVVTADVSVEWLTKELSSVKVGETGYCFLISDTGVFLSHPHKSLIMKESIFSLAEQLNKPELRKLGRLMLAESGGWEYMGDSITKKDSYLGFARLKSTGWSLGVVFPKKELFSDIDRLYSKDVLFAVAALVMLLAVSLFLAGSITMPLRRMVSATAKVASGDLDLDLPATSRHDEVGQLARAFTNMAVNLKNYIRELTLTTAAKERMEGELGVAAAIQRSMLPSTFPAFPDRDEFDIYAVMDPAKEVGGDFYQFLLVDRDRLFVAIGDVSGKGVPASLLMAVTTSLIRSEASEGLLPDEILRRLNKHLLRGNDACMFVTVFCGILNLGTGEVVYANGGHEPPFIVRPNSEILPLPHPGGPLVGIMEDAEFPLEKLTLMPGDALFTYTDGVTEAFNTKEELYGKQRLGEQLMTACPRPIKGMVEEIMKSVAQFSMGAPQSDDITIVGVKFNKITGSGNHSSGSEIVPVAEN
ncbi:MAG: SpoIIE family protein phosphatase [Desulfomonile tiedjei]|uniref:SpoIIE family protein phosphatase n=1 Tax=Desulfomonile tiedjei TaxID=2358 RepID=A0A9D6V274_9BACT|nr:SpoIIE family protein phosphatase [Desulfomonile tiedjei]